jgi:hypothetical protein
MGAHLLFMSHCQEVWSFRLLFGIGIAMPVSIKSVSYFHNLRFRKSVHFGFPGIRKILYQQKRCDRGAMEAEVCRKVKKGLRKA